MAVRRTPPGVVLRPMTAADVAPAADELARGRFGDRGAFLAFAVRHPGCDPIVADHDGSIVGTGVGTPSGAAGWVGVIYVAPEWRGRGLGRALSEAVCDRLEAAGCRTLVLVASAAGRPVYERLGFRLSGGYRVLQAPGLPADPGEAANPPDGPAVRPFDPRLDLDEAIALDRRATGEDRAHLLRAFAGQAGSLAARGADGRLAAFAIHPGWHGAATLATGPDAAIALLRERRRRAGPAGRVRAGIWAGNEAGAAALAADGWSEAWQATRMERGPALDMAPELLYGQFNFALG